MMLTDIGRYLNSGWSKLQPVFKALTLISLPKSALAGASFLCSICHQESLKTLLTRALIRVWQGKGKGEEAAKISIHQLRERSNFGSKSRESSSQEGFHVTKATSGDQEG
eukprot:1143563-Pelagomonas_calceolata.AAC.5